MPSVSALLTRNAKLVNSVRFAREMLAQTGIFAEFAMMTTALPGPLAHAPLPASTERWRWQCYEFRAIRHSPKNEVILRGQGQGAYLAIARCLLRPRSSTDFFRPVLLGRDATQPRACGRTARGTKRDAPRCLGDEAAGRMHDTVPGHNFSWAWISP